MSPGQFVSSPVEVSVSFSGEMLLSLVWAWTCTVNREFLSFSCMGLTAELCRCSIEFLLLWCQRQMIPDVMLNITAETRFRFPCDHFTSFDAGQGDGGRLSENVRSEVHSALALCWELGSSPLSFLPSPLSCFSLEVWEAGDGASGVTGSHAGSSFPSHALAQQQTQREEAAENDFLYNWSLKRCTKPSVKSKRDKGLGFKRDSTLIAQVCPDVFLLPKWCYVTRNTICCVHSSICQKLERKLVQNKKKTDKTWHDA